MIHYLLQPLIAPHNNQHKMILAQKCDNKDINIVINEESHFNTYEEPGQELQEEKSQQWNVCFKQIEDKRWHCADCYKEGLIINLCCGCWESHNKLHNLILLTKQDKDKNWCLNKIFRISDNQDDAKYTCLLCEESLTKKGLAISFNVEIQVFSKETKKIENDFLICLEDFNEFMCVKLESVYPNGKYSLVEWVLQYNRKDWHEVLSNFNKNDLMNIISHIQNLNSEKLYSWNIWEIPIQNKIWVCMDEFCLNLNMEGKKQFSKVSQCVNTLLIWEKHIGANQMCQNTANNGHKIIWFVKGKDLYYEI